MNRRNMFAALIGAAPVAATAAITEPRPVKHCLIDYRAPMKLDRETIHKIWDLPEKFDVTLNGKVIRLVRMIDTKAGMLDTLDVIGDQKPRAGLYYKPEDFPGRDVNCRPDDVLSEYLYGKVQVINPATGEVLYG